MNDAVRANAAMTTRVRPRRLRAVIANIATLLTLFVLFVYVTPILWMVLASFKPANEILSSRLNILPTTWDIGAYIQIVTGGFLTYIRNSAWVAALSTIATAVLALLAAYGFSRHRFRGSRSGMVLIILSQLVPFVVLVTPTYVLYAYIGLADSLLGLTLAYTAVGLPFAVYMLHGYISTVPVSLDEAARIDGAGPLVVLFRIVVPLTWPGIVTVAIYSFTRNWEEFLLASALITSDANKTLPVALAGLFGEFTTQWNVVMAAAAISTLPTLIVFIVLQKRLVGDLTAGAVK